MIHKLPREIVEALEKAVFEHAKPYFKSKLRTAEANSLSLVGIDQETKREMERNLSKDMLLRENNPELYEEMYPRNDWPEKHRSAKAFMMYGPDGCGQSTLAELMAAQCNIAFLPVSFNDIQSSSECETEPRLRALFQVAEENQPCLLYIDEVELKGMTYWEGEHLLRKIICKNSGLHYDLGEKGVQVTLVLGTTSPWELPGKVVRSFQHIFHVRMPNSTERIDMIKSRLQPHHKCLTQEKLERLAEAAYDYSRRDLFETLDWSMRQLGLARYFRKIKIRQRVSIWQRMGCFAMPEAKFLYVPYIIKDHEDAIQMCFCDVPEAAKEMTLFKCLGAGLDRWRQSNSRINFETRYNPRYWRK